MLALMRKLTVASGAASEDVEDIQSRPFQTAEELEESSRRLEEDGLLRKKIVIYMYITHLYRCTCYQGCSCKFVEGCAIL